MEPGDEAMYMYIYMCICVHVGVHYCMVVYRTAVSAVTYSVCVMCGLPLHVITETLPEGH